MRKQPTHQFANVNNIRLHYIKYANEGKPTLLLLHGLTANCMAFEGLISNGLSDNFNIISVDLRGRGLSTHPIFGYTIKAHAKDIIELLLHLKLKDVILVGHSYGGLLSSFLCYYYPQYISKVVFLDAAPEMNPRTVELLAPAFGRLDKVYPNKQAYFDIIKMAPYIHFWDADIEAYYDADIEALPDGTVEPRPDLRQIMQVSLDVAISPIKKYFKGLKQPALLICATEEYNLGEPILPGYLAEKAANNMTNADIEYVAANHFSLVYGKYAAEVVKYIEKFVNKAS
jgi:pimeloyl-ACP methyl ester carboxylesterase